jgi:hypothetical protein
MMWVGGGGWNRDGFGFLIAVAMLRLVLPPTEVERFTVGGGGVVAG